MSGKGSSSSSRKGSSSADHRVRFDAAEEELEKENDIAIIKIEDDKIEVHFGFLQLHTQYVISFSIPRELLNIDKNSTLSLIENTEIHNVNLKASKIVDNDEKAITFEVDYHTYKDKVIDEVLLYRVVGSDRIITLIIISQVLGKGKGTALLKKGVRFSGYLDHEAVHEENMTKCDCDTKLE